MLILIIRLGSGGPVRPYALEGPASAPGPWCHFPQTVLALWGFGGIKPSSQDLGKFAAGATFTPRPQVIAARGCSLNNVVSE